MQVQALAVKPGALGGRKKRRKSRTWQNQISTASTTLKGVPVHDSTDHITIACPKCGQQFQQPCARLYNDINVRCLNCGYHVTVHPATLAQIMEELADWSPEPIGKTGNQ